MCVYVYVWCVCNNHKVLCEHSEIGLSPNGVFESVVCCSREDPVATSQLFDVPQPLELRGVNDLYHQGVQLNVTMDRVIKNLHKIVTALHTGTVHLSCYQNGNGHRTDMCN